MATDLIRPKGVRPLDILSFISQVFVYSWEPWKLLGQVMSTTSIPLPCPEFVEAINISPAPGMATETRWLGNSSKTSSFGFLFSDFPYISGKQKVVD